MPRMEIPGISLHVFVQKWNNELSRGHVQQLREVEKNTFVLKIHTPNGNREIIFSLPSLIGETLHGWKAEDEQPTFVNATKKELGNARIEKISQIGVDRIILFELEKNNLIIELFGEGNLILTDKQNKILAVHDAREWKGRTLKRNHVYRPPTGPLAWNKLPEKINEMKTSMPFRNIGSWMVSGLGIPSASVEKWVEIVGRKQEDTQPLSQSEWKKLRAFMTKKYTHPFMSWMKKEHKGREWILHCLEEGDSEKKEWEKVFRWIEESILAKNESNENNDPHEKERTALHVNLERQQNQIKEWEGEAEEKQKTGEWIYNHFDLVTQIIESVKRATKKKLSNEKITIEIRKKVPQIQHIDSEKGEIELKIE